jgi:ribosome-binding protein aMBF1 (putative translation factor)
MKHSDYKHQIEKDPEYIKAMGLMKLRFDLGDTIIRGRTRNGWAQSELARIVGTKQANISRIEAGLANPTIDLVHRLMQALDIEIQFAPMPSTTSYKNVSFEENPIQVHNWPISFEGISSSQATMPVQGDQS